MLLSPALDRFLAGMEYPALRDDLLREAVREGLEVDDRSLLESLPEQSYGAAWQVGYRLGRERVVDAFASRPLLAA